MLYPDITKFIISMLIGTQSISLLRLLSEGRVSVCLLTAHINCSAVLLLS